MFPYQTPSSSTQSLQSLSSTNTDTQFLINESPDRKSPLSILDIPFLEHHQTGFQSISYSQNLIKSETHQIGLNRIEYEKDILIRIFLEDPQFYYEQHVPISPIPNHSRAANSKSESIDDSLRMVTREALIEHATKMDTTIPDHQLYPKSHSPLEFLTNFFSDCKK